jgi:hypothetical protein
MWNQILGWLASTAFLELLKKVGKWAWGYAVSYLKSLWDNAWVITWASICTTLFLTIMGLLNSWYGFPLILNTMLHGIYHLGNLAWVISNWKRAPAKSGSENKGPKVSVE